MRTLKSTKKLARVAALLTVLCLISMVMIGGTFAKYTSEYAGQDTALIARWQFEATDGTNDFNEGDVPTHVLDLFSHDYDVHVNQNDGADYIIAPGVNDEFTVEMSFLSDVDATVTVGFTKTADVKTDGLPIEFLVVDRLAGSDPADAGDTTDDADWVSLAELPDAFVAQLVENNDGLTVAADPADNTFTFTRSGIDDENATTISQVVKWRWAFDDAEQAADAAHTKDIESDDDVDTGFGNTSATGGAARSSYVLNVSVKAEQIKPTE